MYKTLIKNSSYLYLLHLVNIVLPLLVFPYLVRILGVENFGIVAFSLAFMGYFSLLVNYGFDLGSTRDISISRENSEKINKIFSATLYIKIILLMVGFLIMITLSTYFDFLYKNIDIYYLSYGVVAGIAIMPNWLYQGLERLRLAAVIGVSTRILYVIFIFIFVKSANDYDIVLIITSLTAILNGVLGLFFALYLLDVKFVLISKTFMKKTLVDNWDLFISKISISVYSISTVFILGIYTTEREVGIYAAAEKIIRAIQGFLNPVSQAFFPHIANILSTPLRLLGLKKLLNVGLVVTSIFFVISTTLFLFSNEIVSLILGSGYESSAFVFRILAFIPFIVAISNFIGVQYMLNSSMKSIYVLIIVIASIVSIILMLTVVPIYGYIGSSYVLLFVESFVSVYMVAYVLLMYFRKGTF
jgi:polysaccharide transporter, PST family